MTWFQWAVTKFYDAVTGFLRADGKLAPIYAVAFRGYKFKTMSGLPFTYTLKKGRGDEFTKELWIDRREDSKSLAWSSVMLAYHNIGKIGEVVDRPKALEDIRGVSYIYGLFYRFGLIDVPDKAKDKIDRRSISAPAVRCPHFVR